MNKRLLLPFSLALLFSCGQMNSNSTLHAKNPNLQQRVNLFEVNISFKVPDFINIDAGLKQTSDNSCIFTKPLITNDSLREAWSPLQIYWILRNPKRARRYADKLHVSLDHVFFREDHVDKNTLSQDGILGFLYVQDKHLRFFKVADSFLNKRQDTFGGKLVLDKDKVQLMAKTRNSTKKCTADVYRCKNKDTCSYNTMNNWLKFSKIYVTTKDVLGIPTGIEKIEYK